MILAILIAWMAYKKATASGRNGALWAVAGAAVFIGTQLVVQFGLGILLGVWLLADPDMSEDALDSYTLPLTIVSIVASFGSSWLLLRYLDRPVMSDDEFTAEPPPPPTFSENQ